MKEKADSRKLPEERRQGVFLIGNCVLWDNMDTCLGIERMLDRNKWEHGKRMKLNFRNLKGSMW